MGCLDRATQGEYFSYGNEIQHYPWKKKPDYEKPKIWLCGSGFCTDKWNDRYEKM